MADVAIVGAGIVGLATAYALGERGVACDVYERGRPGNGQSGGESRIFRHAHDDPRLAAFARDSRAVWDEWTRELGTELVSADGAVAIGSPVERRLAVLEQVGGIPARRLGAGELAQRMPLLAPYDGHAMLDEAGGAIRTRAAVAALTRSLGDALVADEVLTLRPLPGGAVELRAVNRRAEYAHVVVCAGRATPELARGAVGLSLPVAHAAHVRLTFAVRDEPPARLPCLQDGSGAFGETGVYGAPQPGNVRYALGLSEATAVREDGSPIDRDGLASLSERARAYVEGALPGLDPRPLAHVHCWVTTLPWGADGVAVWQREAISFVAGHNLFKQAPGLGRALARAATGEPLLAELMPSARLGEPPAA